MTYISCALEPLQVRGQSHTDFFIRRALVNNNPLSSDRFWTNIIIEKML
jgi:hypothetical protein